VLKPFSIQTLHFWFLDKSFLWQPNCLSDFIIWLALWAGKMNQILHCDWLPQWVRWSYLAHLELPTVSRKKNFPESHIINPLLTKLVRSRWLDIGLIRFIASLWTSTQARSINTQKKNLANIQPSWPHTWSITHMYSNILTCIQITFPMSCPKKINDITNRLKALLYW